MTTGTDTRLRRDTHLTRERLVAAVVDAVQGPAGRVPLVTREHAFTLARAGGESTVPSDPLLLGAARALVEAVADRAHDVPAEMVKRALAAGRSEHEVFDLIVVAAVGGGLTRRELGLAAIDSHLTQATAEDEV